MALDKNKEDMIARIVSAMEAEGRFIQQNDDYSTDNKLSRMDVILDVVHFLGDYENNVRILNKHNGYLFPYQNILEIEHSYNNMLVKLNELEETKNLNKNRNENIDLFFLYA